ncbi:AP2-like DNA-binding integrase domain-containing protein [Gracilibacillus ureilyticus]|uniref:AP2-like DNA-binding integrase domain-containing protein n=1 Tax=Gracilibacillus ureilyticus TaxID=531814 RepID=A0A1H9TBG9_9BACI|nr:tyrosine-type recombinase/integrase [Gracilibacillus ureilyticus]SER94501.1 AP2-like DNA-binding integrase domain-containing protein [Gracilibacillus ureilyticus]
MKLNKSKKDPELYYYSDTKGKKKWMYRHKYYDQYGKRREKKGRFNTEKEAYQALLKLKVDTIRGATKPVEFSNYTVAQWFDTWYETYKHNWKISTRTQRESAIRVHIKPLLGSYKLSELSRSTFQKEFINTLLNDSKKPKEPSTVKSLYSIFKIGINSAVEEEIIPRNRFTKLQIGIEKNEEDKKKDKNEKKKNASKSSLKGNYLEAHELNKLLVKAKKILNITNYTLLLTLAYTGLRKGEGNGLCWNDIDFENRTLTIERTRDNKGVRPPKTDNSYRIIVLDESIIDQLKTYKIWCKKTLLAFGRHLKEEDFVFISYQTGRPLSDNTVNNALDRVIKKVGIKRITPHGLRHTHATILLNDKENRSTVEDVAARLGNTPEEIHKTYHHILQERKKETATLFTELVSSAGN